MDTGPFTLRGHVPRILPALALATPDIHPLRPRSLQNPCYNPRSNLSAEQDWDMTQFQFWCSMILSFFAFGPHRGLPFEEERFGPLCCL